MKLKFLGTKGEIEEQTEKHKYNSSLLIQEKGFRLLIDHGMISRKLSEIKPDAILITHGHPDHFIWLKKDEEYQGDIYITRDTEKLAKFRQNFKIIKLNKWFRLGPFNIIAYPVIHSFIAPAVGFKIMNKKTIIYNPDLVVMKNKSILKNTDLYIGDGSILMGNLVRRKGEKLFGHAGMRTQVNWCSKYNIPNIIFTHLGKGPLRLGDKKLKKQLNNNRIKVEIAKDNLPKNL